MPVIELAEKADSAGLIGQSFDDVNDAVEAARLRSNKNDVIMICGSFFIIAEMNESNLTQSN